MELQFSWLFLLAVLLCFECYFPTNCNYVQSIMPLTFAHCSFTLRKANISFKVWNPNLRSWSFCPYRLKKGLLNVYFNSSYTFQQNSCYPLLHKDWNDIFHGFYFQLWLFDFSIIIQQIVTTFTAQSHVTLHTTLSHWRKQVFLVFLLKS